MMDTPKDTVPFDPPSSQQAAHHDSTSSKKALAMAYRKIDWCIIPPMFLCYFLQFLDKILINYANIMGLSSTLHFKGNDFSWMATAFFIGYAVAEVPQGYLIQRFPVHKVLGINVILWGVVVCCTAAVRNFREITALRTMLGALEAVITPALIVTTSQWYTRGQATPRTGIWYCGLGAGQFLGGLISWAAQHGPRAGFESWRIMFVAVGVFNLLVGFAVTLWMPSTIRDAKRILSEEEMTAVEKALERDNGGNSEDKVFRARGLWEVVADLQVWLLFLNTILIVIPSGIITTFSATLIRSFGYTPKQAALLNMPSGIVSIFATLSSTLAIRCHFPRWLAIILLLIPTLIGAALMSFHSYVQSSALAGIYLINFTVAPLALIYALAGANTQGYTKRVATSGSVAVAFSIANIIGPLTFREKDAPGYLPAKVTVLAVCGGAMGVTVALRVLYGVRNESRRQAVDGGRSEEEAGSSRGFEHETGRREDMTDRTNPAFEYVY